jgi:hypothetical protein
MFDFVLGLGIRLASAAVLLGWGLSALGELNGRGYVVAGVPLLVIVGILSLRGPGAPKRGSMIGPWIRRWKGRRILPLIYLVTFGLIVLGSVWHEPNNYDGLSYRIPKVLYWLDQHRWHWINAPFQAINYTLPNYEWVTVPLFLATGGFHGTVVINWIAFLALPSLFFTLLRAFGVPGRLAYDWMWIFPSGYLIALEAGSIGNDLIGLAFILAALHCANRFVATTRASGLFDALLAAGFCTGVKVTNLPLAVFVLIILLKNLKLLRARCFVFAIAATLAALVSALIPILLNLAYSGSILGTTSSDDQAQSPVAGWLGNGLILLMAALMPPLFPGANQITALLEHSLGRGLDAWLRLGYVKFSLRVNELPQEESGALGLGITLALMTSIVLWMGCDRAGNLSVRKSRLLPWQKIVWWGWLGFAGLVVAARLGTGPSVPRNLLPWYPLLLAPVIAFFGCGRTTRSSIWRMLAPLVSLSVVPALLLTPSRPLIPQSILLQLAQKSGASAALVERLNLVYDIYARRTNPFAAIVNELPQNARVLGLIDEGNEPTAAWWKPYGSRRCIYLRSETEVNAARAEGVQYIVVKELSCRQYFNTDTAHWLETHQARPIKTIEVRVLATVPPIRYTLAQFEPNAR